VPDLEPPNLGEVLRRLDDLRSDVADLIAEMKADRAENARIYVRSDVYNVAQTAQNAIVADLHRDVGKVDTEVRADLATLEAQMRAEVLAVKTDANAKFTVIENDRKAEVAWRRQATLAIAGLFVTIVLAAIGFVINYATK
jgi:hypothetical protein